MDTNNKQTDIQTRRLTGIKKWKDGATEIKETDTYRWRLTD